MGTRFAKNLVALFFVQQVVVLINWFPTTALTNALKLVHDVHLPTVKRFIEGKTSLALLFQEDLVGGSFSDWNKIRPKDNKLLSLQSLPNNGIWTVQCMLSALPLFILLWLVSRAWLTMETQLHTNEHNSWYPSAPSHRWHMQFFLFSFLNGVWTTKCCRPLLLFLLLVFSPPEFVYLPRCLPKQWTTIIQMLLGTMSVMRTALQTFRLPRACKNRSSRIDMKK